MIDTQGSVADDALSREQLERESLAFAAVPGLQRYLARIDREAVGEVLAELRATGVRRTIVGTASCGIGQLAFYQKTGFRLWKIERDFFTSERGYPEGLEENGILLRDMVWMEQILDESQIITSEIADPETDPSPTHSTARRRSPLCG